MSMQGVLVYSEPKDVVLQILIWRDPDQFLKHSQELKAQSYHNITV